MAQLIADRRDVDFVLHEQLKVEELARHERFAEFNRKAVDLIISEARNLAIRSSCRPGRTETGRGPASTVARSSCPNPSTRPGRPTRKVNGWP